MVRYLRNTLMAKLGGEQTELLQISADERARAARTALLFTEEELTRNLQIVLRTFDDLNYRQEQRFHLELGLLKLIHAQRLLPIEELLSGVATGAGTRPTVASGAPRAGTMTSPRAADQSAPVHAVSSRAAIGFSAAVDMKSSAPSAQGATPASFGSTQVSAVVNQPNSFAGFTPSVEESGVPATPTAPSSTPAVDAMRDAVRGSARRKRAQLSLTVAGHGNMETGRLDPANRGSRRQEKDARTDGECRGGEDRPAGVAAAGRARAISW